MRDAQIDRVMEVFVSELICQVYLITRTGSIIIARQIKMDEIVFY